MYAIREANAGYGIGGRSADKHSGEWWRGDRWTPASDEAKTFDTAAEADRHAAEHCSRDYVVVVVEVTP